MKKFFTLLVCLCMVISVFAGCGNNTVTSSEDTASKEIINNSDLIDAATGEIVNIGSPTTMKITPEEVGQLTNPIVRGLEAWPKKDGYQWKEDAYGLIYDYDTCDGEQRHAKWISAFVSGDAYDIFTLLSTDFPTLAQKGLLQPLEKIMPVYDENYFNQTISNFFTWKGRVYAVSPHVGAVNTYGIHFNKTYFDNIGEDTPMDYYERGEWDFDALYNVMKTMISEDYPMNFNFSYLSECAVAANGGAFFKNTDTGAELTLKDPKTMEALEWVHKMYGLNTGWVGDAYNEYREGKLAIHIERPHQLNTFREDGTYEYGWVPFPKGPSGDGLQTGLGSAWGIGKGAKNIEGAMAYIASEAYYDTYAELKGIVSTESTNIKEDEKELITGACKHSTINSLNGLNISIYDLNNDAYAIGYAAAIEKHSPEYQAALDEILGIEAEVGKLDFEDQGVFNFDTAQSEYPFVNAIDDQNFVYGVDDIQSLKIDLTSTDAFSPIFYTKPELFNLQQGGQYRVTFKLYCKDEVPSETLAVAARTTKTLDGAPTFGLTWLEVKAGEICEVEVYINVNENFTGDLAVVFLGSAIEGLDNTSILIDDFHVELVKAE